MSTQTRLKTGMKPCFFCVFALVSLYGLLLQGCTENEQDSDVDGDSELVSEMETEEIANFTDGDLDFEDEKESGRESELAEELEAEISDGDSDLESEEIAESEEEGGFDPNACNGHESLCGKRFNEVAYATVHNAMSNAEDDWGVPNNLYGMSRQMDDGVRSMMLDVHYFDDEVYLCHGTCYVGRKLLVDGLLEIKGFLDANPREVMSFLFESYVSDGDLAQVFEDAGLLEYLHTQVAGEDWPTLQEMVDSGRKIVVFVQSGGGEPAWLHNLWQFAWDTDYDNKVPEDFSCDILRGSLDNELFILNHFLTNPVAKQELAEQVNYNPFFIERVLQCMEEHQQLANFVTVDFYSVGDLFYVVNELNGVDEE